MFQTIFTQDKQVKETNFSLLKWCNENFQNFSQHKKKLISCDTDFSFNYNPQRDTINKNVEIQWNDMHNYYFDE